MSEIVATNLLVPGRGHERRPDGSLGLSESAVQRVSAAVLHFEQHRDVFERSLDEGLGGVVVMSGGFAALATANRMMPPLYERREGTLMMALAESRGIPARHLRNEASSTSTMENVLRTQEAGYLGELSPQNPLGIVTQASQLGRLTWFAQKIFRITPDAIVHVDAPGEEDEQILRDERKLLRITKLVYGMAQTPNGLRGVERTLGVAAAITTRIGLQQSPADSYLRSESS